MARPDAPKSSGDSPQRPLNRERILDGAVALIEAEGPTSLSMRRLGSRLGVEGMSIYHHFANRDALLAAIGDRLLAPLQTVALGDEWRDACRRFATALRGLAVAQPATFRLLGLAPLDSPAALAPVENLLGVLVAAGFSAPAALGVYRAVVSYSRGYALAEATGFTVDAAQDMGRRRLAALSPSEFPILAGRARELAELDADSGFMQGLEALLRGLDDPA
ncbi:MAG TPA: TetR/AcrR family transcriptional regulator C-terminal domain-containing protein [Solirubrobacteraceae bacterium]|nr:TetR/AcrR family transcriptional regulator C-terminal domain-containing protein [Solirubrobacteraceae bacterium]